MGKFFLSAYHQTSTIIDVSFCCYDIFHEVCVVIYCFPHNRKYSDIGKLVNITNIAKFVLIADDLNLIFHNSWEKLYRIGNEILQELFKYCNVNRLIINYEKCCYMEFVKVSKDSQSSEYFLGVMNNQFCKVDSCKFLGVILNSSLNWNESSIKLPIRLFYCTSLPL